MELKSKIDKLNSIKKDEQIQMLEKANELDSIREEMEKALAEFESIKNKKAKAKESLKWAEKILNQKQPFVGFEKSNETNRSKQCESTFEFDTRFDIENTDPNVENAVTKFYDSSANVIFQSPIPEDDLSDRDLREEDIQSNEIIINTNENSNIFNNYKRSLSRGGNRSSQMMNPLTESYECNNNPSLERYNSMGRLALKPKKKKVRNSYRYINNGSSQSILQNLKVPLNQNNFTETGYDKGYEENLNDHQKSTKMLIDCLMKQLNPVTAYISDFNLKNKRWRKKDVERSRNETSASMFLDIQEKMKGSHNNHLTWTSNIRARTSHYLNFNTKE